MIVQNLRFKSLKDFSKLPFYDLDADNNLVLKSNIIDQIIDFHSHLGLRYFLAGRINYHQTTGQPHFIPKENYTLDLSHHSSFDYSDSLKKKLKKSAIKTFFTKRGKASCFTLPSIFPEMRRLRISKSVVLAIDLPGVSNNSLEYLKVGNEYDQIEVFASVHPQSVFKYKKIDQFINLGCLGFKIHPGIMMVRPDHEKFLPLYDICQKTGLAVLFHTGASRLMNSWQRRFVRPKYYLNIIKMFPKLKVILGHGGGSTDVETMVSYQQKYDQVYLQFDGQPPNFLKKILTKVDSDRILYGSDWPMYPMVIQLSKMLLATDHSDSLRRKILFENAHNLIKDLKEKVELYQQISNNYL